MLLIKKAVAALVSIATLNFAFCETLSMFRQTDIEACSWATSEAKESKGRQATNKVNIT